ncbi:hypothetical protein EYC84_009536 [Monilinia fructicola]|uniref:Uncharacterized protein n=1 Tax=Monilinia fructicola TaxID=38448 RepID=A0A5M9JCR5_MONFR|nr:hypothetical protein EYC84_009536 [Monilinia fructicola]
MTDDFSSSFQFNCFYEILAYMCVPTSIQAITSDPFIRKVYAPLNANHNAKIAVQYIYQCPVRTYNTVFWSRISASVPVPASCSLFSICFPEPLQDVM